MSSKTSKYGPPQTSEELVLAWLRRAREAQLAHYEMAEILAKRGRYLGIPVVVLTTLVGASAFASLVSDLAPAIATMVVGFASLTAAVLSSLQTLFNHSDKAEKHKVSAGRFGAVRRKLEQLYANRDKSISPDVVELLRQELDALSQESLDVPRHIFLKVQKNLLYVGDMANSTNGS